MSDEKATSHLRPTGPADGSDEREKRVARLRAEHGGLRSVFDEAMLTVKDDVLRLGALVESALERAGRALTERDVELANQVRWDDGQVNDLQRRVNQEVTTAMALQQPMARDLRELLALYHAAAELERMGDYAVNIAKLAQQLSDEPEAPLLPQIPLMGQLCRSQLRDAMRALVDVSEADARAVCARDDEIDALYNAVYEETMSIMAAHPDRVRQATHMLFAAHHLERLGDRVTNIGEDVVYVATGRVEDLNA
ncbi:MAG TPA: phosphate signaling complex protein PhoU [Candidatus Limnocylindria bacterium]|nr:phosphate signaling complex protein PhoU [Candidatus Limnocylindria bacterium]